MAAFICLLECITIGLQISDTHFFNFGVRFFSDFATEHVVVLIDAGSRGWHPDSPRWSKGEVNQKTMKKFWENAAKHNALDPDLQQLWRDNYEVDSALAAAKAKWVRCSMLTDRPVPWQLLLDSLGDAAEEEAQEMKSTSAYKIIHFVASHHWNPTATFHTVCYRAYKEMQTSREQNKILDDLHWRMTCQRWSNASVDDIVGFWYSLLDYRVNVLSERPWRCTEDRFTEDVALTTTEVAQAIHKWEDDFLWYEATAGQRRYNANQKKSLFRNMLHKKAAWFFAAMAVLEIGLPSLTLPDEPHAATMRVRTMANFAEAMALWLEQFSAAMVKHQASPCYQRALEYSKKKEDRPQEDRGEKPKKANPFRCA